MLRIPSDGKGVVKFIGIDPGTSFPGVCVLSYDVPNKQIVRVAAHCFDLERLARRSVYSEYQNPRYLKIIAFREVLRDLLRSERPLKVSSESPFINVKRPGAVIPLAECLFMIEEVLFEHNPYLSLDKIPPSPIKQAVGVAGNSGDKNAMTEAIKKIPEIMDVLIGDINTMNNNAVDSVAVAFCSLQRELNHEHDN